MDVDSIVERPLNDEKPVKEGWKRYDTKNSPFLELQTPFTGWWGCPLPASTALSVLNCGATSRAVNTASCIRREAFKLVVLLPWLLPRMIIAVLSLVILAMLSGAAALGW
jgi:hypothetical protein